MEALRGLHAQNTCTKIQDGVLKARVKHYANVFAMDGLASLFSNLRNSDITLEERVELCRQILGYNECYLPNKNQVLFDWLCQELNKNNSPRQNGDDDEPETELWKLLSEVLNDSTNEQIILPQKFLPFLLKELDKIRQFIGQLCSKNKDLYKSSHDRVLCVFLCCQAISKNPNMSLTVFNKLENLEQYLKGILACFLAVLLHNDLHSAKFVGELFSLVGTVLNQYNNAQQQQVAHHRVFTNLCKNLLLLLLLVKNTLKDENVFCCENFNRDEINSAIDAVITSGLFHKDLVANYTPTVIPRNEAEPSPKKPKLGNPYKELFETLESFAKGDLEEAGIRGIPISSDLVCQMLSTSLPFLLENFLKATEENKMLNKATKFSFFIELLNITDPSGSGHGEMLNKDRIEILAEMLNMVVKYDVYQIAEDNATDKPIFKWFLCLMETELLCEPPSAARFQCLDLILKLNHKIIENSLETVLAKCFVKFDKETKERDEAKIRLLCDVVETYSKLKQSVNLVEILLKVFKELGNELGIIPVNVLTKLSKSFENCSFNQTLNVAQFFLSEMKERVQSMQDGETDLATEGVATLFVNFLLNSSYNAVDPHGVDQKKATSLDKLVREIKDAVIIPLVEAFPTLGKTAQKEVGFISLFLSYGLNSLIRFLHQHNVISTSEDHYVHMSWDPQVEAYIPHETWRELPILKKNRRLRFCMELLVVQRVRCFLLKENFDQNEFDQMIYFLYNFQDSETISEISSVSWNSDPSCVNSSNYPVAHWSLVTQYALLLIPYCSDDQLQNFAEFMIRTLVLQEKENKADNLVTLHDVSEKILKGGELFQLFTVQAAIVKQFWKCLGECISKVVGEKLSEAFTWEAVEDKDAQMEDGQGPDKPNLQYKKINMSTAVPIAQAIAKVMNDEDARKQSKKKPNGDMHVVVDLLKVLQRLPCHQFAAGSQARCILGSLACDVLMGKAATSDGIGPHAERFSVQLSCRKIVSNLLQGLLQRREFSAWQVVEMASFLRWLYRTIPPSAATKTSRTNIESQFMHASKDLLKYAVMVTLKLHKKASVAAIVDFTSELLTSLTNSSKTTILDTMHRIQVLVIIVSACTEFFEQQRRITSSQRTAFSIISNAAVSLASFTKGFLEENSGSASYIELENDVMRLCAVLQRAMGWIPETELANNEELTNVSKEWTDIVFMLVAKILRKMVDAELNVTGETATLIKVLSDLFKSGKEQSNSIPDELRTQILRKCLAILRYIGFSVREQVGDKNTKNSEESRKLQEAVLGLISGLLEENDGRNCIMVLEGVLQWSVEENAAQKDTLANLLTGLSVFKDLLGTKVVELKKKELRLISGKILITMLSKATISNEVLVVVQETVAALVTIGAGVFNPHGLALMFQALVLNVEVTSTSLFCRIFMARFAILSWTLYYYSDYVYEAVHVFLPCVRELLNGLLVEGVKTSSGNMASEEKAILLSCVQKMSRLYQEMVSHKEVLSKYSIYLLADCVHVMSTHGVPGTMRDILVQGVHSLFDICDDDGFTKLHVYLPNNERELFRSLKEGYLKHHKFKGNA